MLGGEEARGICPPVSSSGFIPRFSTAGGIDTAVQHHIRNVTAVYSARFFASPDITRPAREDDVGFTMFSTLPATYANPTSAIVEALATMSRERFSSANGSCVSMPR